MEKVKIFTHGTTHMFDELEAEVNQWFAENNTRIEVLSRQMTSAAGINSAGRGFVNCSIAIFYREK